VEALIATEVLIIVALVLLNGILAGSEIAVDTVGLLSARRARC
jgi:hypothetical protein